MRTPCEQQGQTLTREQGKRKGWRVMTRRRENQCLAQKQFRAICRSSHLSVTPPSDTLLRCMNTFSWTVRSCGPVRSAPREKVEGAAQITDKFAQYFGSVYEHFQLDSEELWPCALRSPVMPGVPVMTLAAVTRNEVLSAHQKLKPKTSVEPDGLPPYIFKACSELLNNNVIFNYSIGAVDLASNSSIKDLGITFNEKISF
ncbi:hypothetical protein J6590_066781 [Homalodisca vitripennis]|nr:hypothetical protein J6590_066781 [Homalodisca vitripennis]